MSGQRELNMFEFQVCSAKGLAHPRDACMLVRSIVSLGLRDKNVSHCIEGDELAVMQEGKRALKLAPGLSSPDHLTTHPEAT